MPEIGKRYVGWARTLSDKRGWKAVTDPCDHLDDVKNSLAWHGCYNLVEDCAAEGWSTLILEEGKRPIGVKSR